jgi:hypothetical protein
VHDLNYIVQGKSVEDRVDEPEKRASAAKGLLNESRDEECREKAVAI